MANFECNINGCLNQYKDVDGALKWFDRAEKELTDREYIQLTDTTIGYKYLSDERFSHVYSTFKNKQLNLYGREGIKTKLITDIEVLLKSYRFEEAAQCCEQNKEYVDEKSYLDLKKSHQDKQHSEKAAFVMEELESFLSYYRFEEADQFYEQNKEYVDKKSYLDLKKSYQDKQYSERAASVMKELENLLSSYRFEEADSIYKKNRDYVDKEKYLNLREKCKTKRDSEQLREKTEQKLESLLLKQGLLVADEYFRKQSVFGVDEYETHRRKRISKFLSEHLDFPFNNEQVDAIGAISSNVLLKARAGSGKTSVVAGKTYFLVEHERVHPDHVMLLAFNKKAADDITRRIRKDYGLVDFKNARTFHSLAYQLVQPKEDLLFDEGGENLSTKRQSKFIQRIVKQAINPVFKEEMYRVFKTEMRELENIGELLSSEDYLLYRRNHKQLTLRGDYVKSLGEKYIGDFLFEHGIKHRYEKIWDWKKENYKPDFTVFANSDTPNIVIEHWGIDENDPSYSIPEHWTESWLEYKAVMEGKRAFWEEYNRKNPADPVLLIETSIVDLAKGRNHFEHILRSKLSAHGIKLLKLSDEELYKRLEMVHLVRLTIMFTQYIQKARKQRLSPGELKKRIDKIDRTNDRVCIFAVMANAIYRKYLEELKRTNSIDFDELIERAVGIINKSHGNCDIRTLDDRRVKLSELRWLMIDEYQDFSLLFHDLIESIRKHNNNVRLFCVGDDWQAINAFAGSNLRYFTNFDSYVIPSETRNLLTNYRSVTNIVELANKSMEGRGEEAIAHSNKVGRIFKCYTNKVFIKLRQDNSAEAKFDRKFLSFERVQGKIENIDKGLVVGRMLKACHLIITRRENLGKTIDILSHKRRLSQWYDGLEVFRNKLKKTFKEYPIYPDFDKKVRVGTIHSFKGLEADIVIMLNVVRGEYPMIHPDEELYEIFDSTPKDILEEERRLFYVGMTRAKSKLYFFTEEKRESEFIKEMPLPEDELNYFIK
jgi:DNA helicase IV